MNFNSTKVQVSKYTEKPQRSLLAKYGEQAFENEKCTRCHVLNLKEEKWGKKSLDGFGGSRSSSLLSDFLINPKILYPSTRMPSFEHLQLENLNKKTLRESFGAKLIPESEFELAWKSLNNEADSLVRVINKKSTNKHLKSESTAIIGFLQSITQNDN